MRLKRIELLLIGWKPIVIPLDHSRYGPTANRMQVSSLQGRYNSIILWALWDRPKSNQGFLRPRQGGFHYLTIPIQGSGFEPLILWT